MKNLTLRPLLFVYLFIVIANCNIWDNIFSQTQASYPIMLSQSFNIDIPLPSDFQFDANIDFSSELKVLTLKISKSILTQKVQFAKIQFDLEQFIVNVEQILIGCQKYALNLQNQQNGQIKKNLQGINVSKKKLFLLNLFFKYIGKYQTQNSVKQDIETGILDVFKGNKIFDSIVDTGVLGDITKNSKNSTDKEMNIFQFSMNFYENSNELIEKIKDAKNTAQKDLQLKEIEDLDIENFDLQMIKFVILTDEKSGDILKAYKNKQMKQELNLSLKSNEKKKVQCNKQAKKLTIEDLKNGANYLVQNKDSLGGLMG